MDKIHILPLSPDCDGWSRSYEALKKSFDAGEDLGPRDHHIQILSRVLSASQRDLRYQIEIMRAGPTIPDIDLQALLRSVEAWADSLAALASSIQRSAIHVSEEA